jgi:hypothetical protein
MSKKSSPQSERNTTTQNDTPPRLTLQNPSMSDNPNSESDNSSNIVQRELDSNPAPTATTNSSSLTQASLISQTLVTTTNRTVSLETRQRLLERQRSLDSLLTEALRISEQALTELRRRNEYQRATTVTLYSRQSSYNNGSDDDDESNTPESSSRNSN